MSTNLADDQNSVKTNEQVEVEQKIDRAVDVFANQLRAYLKNDSTSKAQIKQFPEITALDEQTSGASHATAAATLFLIWWGEQAAGGEIAGSQSSNQR